MDFGVSPGRRGATEWWFLHWGRVLKKKKKQDHIKIASSIYTEDIEDLDNRKNVRVWNKSVKEEENIVIVHKRLRSKDLY